MLPTPQQQGADHVDPSGIRRVVGDRPPAAALRAGDLGVLDVGERVARRVPAVAVVHQNPRDGHLAVSLSVV
jgi:hypothetical protein